LSDLPALLKKWRGGGKLLQGMVHGVELAMFDLMGRVLDVPVSSLLGGAVVRDMPEYLSLSCDTPESMAKVVRSRGTVFPVIQAKMSGDIDSDLQRVQHVLEAMNRDQILLADFNCALRPEDAIRALSEVRDGRLMWEEPCEGYESNLAVARAIEMPVMFDQCLDGLPAFMRAIEDKAAAALVIKPDVIGGLSIGRIARDICAEAGIPIRIDGWWSGQISASGALHLAAGAATSALMATIDLTDPLDTDRSLINKPVAGRVAPANGPGLGALPSDLFRLMSSTCRGLSRDLT
jgi:L-alanine-DL-glutamate epimerase-like enolase superfamily enzyme